MTWIEQHETKTAYNISIALKLVIVRFVNTAIVPVIININSDRWFVDGGLISDFFSIMCTTSILDPLLTYINPVYQIQRLKRWYETRKQKECTLTQA